MLFLDQILISLRKQQQFKPFYLHPSATSILGLLAQASVSQVALSIHYFYKMVISILNTRVLLSHYIRQFTKNLTKLTLTKKLNP